MRDPSVALPGEDLVKQGIQDLARGEATLAALLVSIGAHRMRRAGVAIPSPLSDPEHRLYLLLARDFGDDAHSRYNALVRQLISYEHAIERANSRGDSPAPRPGSSGSI